MIKIFIADDHPIVTTGIEALLKHAEGKQFVGSSHTTEHLIQVLKEQTVDVLLLDLNIPGDNFLSLIPKLRKHFPSLKIVIYTSYKERKLTKAIFKLKINGYVLKDSSPPELLQAIEQAHQGLCFVSMGVEMSGVGAKSDTSPKPNPNGLLDPFQKKQSLSKREREIFDLICQGKTGQNISQILFISKHTVETHRKNILRKLNVSNSMELVRLAVQQGLA